VSLPTGWGARPSAGVVVVAGGAQSAPLSMSSLVSICTSYSITFAETGLAPSTSWSVRMAGVVENSASSELNFSEPNGTYNFVALNVSGYVPNPASGSINVSGAPVGRSIAFTSVVISGRYTVSVAETGLPNGSLWEVALAGISETSVTNTLSYVEANGSYNLTVASISNYWANYPASVLVAGAPVTVVVVFSETEYPVTFTETGLPSGDYWTVIATDPATQIGTSAQSAGASTTLQVPKGTYAISAVGPSGYSVELSSTTINVSGSNQPSIQVTFVTSPTGSVSSASPPWVITGYLVVVAVAAMAGAGWGYTRYRYTKGRSEAIAWVQEFHEDAAKLDHSPPQ
jgi:hypothetical protein